MWLGSEVVVSIIPLSSRASPKVWNPVLGCFVSLGMYVSTPVVTSDGTHMAMGGVIADVMDYEEL